MCAEAAELDALQTELRRAVSSIQSSRSRLFSDDQTIDQASSFQSNANGIMETVIPWKWCEFFVAGSY